MNALEWQVIGHSIQNHTGTRQQVFKGPSLSSASSACCGSLISQWVSLSRNHRTQLFFVAESHRVLLPFTKACSSAHEQFRNPQRPSHSRNHCAQRFKDKTLRIWSAACADGQEAYSMALLLAESFPELRNWSVQILGTDISPDLYSKSSKTNFTLSLRSKEACRHTSSSATGARQAHTSGPSSFLSTSALSSPCSISQSHSSTAVLSTLFCFAMS